MPRDRAGYQSCPERRSSSHHGRERHREGTASLARFTGGQTPPRGGLAACANCSRRLLPALIAADLFGHEKGAFTGANQRRAGRFEVANHGTVFLDEIGDMPAETQVSLLRVLQEREFERIGGNRSIPVDVRVIAATNCDLSAAVGSREFRPDLFYRLNVFPICVPPLRERREDILLLAKYFIERYAANAGKRIRSVDKRTAQLLEDYHWPGNIRELQNVIQRAVILCGTETLAVEEAWLSSTSDRTHSPQRRRGRGQKERIEAALAECRGRISGPRGAATRLGLPRTTVIGSRFVENLPLTELGVEPPVSLAAWEWCSRSQFLRGGQFSVNGQRPDTSLLCGSDGVSANLGTAGSGANLAQGGAGQLPATSAFGGTSNLVPLDALEEFRIQTSTFAPEYGRTPERTKYRWSQSPARMPFTVRRSSTSVTISWMPTIGSPTRTV